MHRHALLRAGLAEPELGQVLCDRVGDTQLPLLYKLHNRDRGKGFCDRTYPEDGVRIGCDLLLDVTIPKTLEVHLFS